MDAMRVTPLAFRKMLRLGHYVRHGIVPEPMGSRSPSAAVPSMRLAISSRISSEVCTGNLQQASSNARLTTSTVTVSKTETIFAIFDPFADRVPTLKLATPRRTRENSPLTGRLHLHDVGNTHVR